MEIRHTDIRTELFHNRFVIISTSGVSMKPLLYDKGRKDATQVLIEPVTGQLRVGELPLFERQDGKLVIHRVIEVRKDSLGNAIMYRTRGDNCMSCEQIHPDKVLGMVTKIYRKRRTINVTDCGYRMYVRIWNAIYPLRYIWYRMRVRVKKA